MVYVICAAEFFLRFVTDRPIRGIANRETTNQKARQPIDIRMKIMIGGLAFSTICLFIRYVNPSKKTIPVAYKPPRAVYRTIELADGWNGRIISTQVYFSALIQSLRVI